MKCTIALLIVILFSACLTRTERPQSGANQNTLVLAKQENSKYKLTAIFYGERIGADTPPVLKHISLRNDATGQEIIYQPEEPFNGNNTWNAWSPEGDFLLLMRGDFKGICILQASEAEREIANHSCYDFIRIYEKSTGTPLLHTFGVWSNGEEFQFAAGLSGNTWDFTYNVKTRVLKITGPARNFEGENRYGKVPLSG